MPFGTITSTSNTFGTVSGDVGANVPGTLTGSVGVPGPQGPAGPGSTWGGIVGTLSAQTDLWSALGAKYDASNPNGFITSAALAPYLTSATAATTYYPLTGNPSGFITGSALTPYLLSSTAASTYQTLAGMSSYLTTSAAASTYYPLSGNPSGFLTSSALTGYATQSFVAANYAPIAAGLPTGGTVGQVLTKQSGTDFDASFQTLIPGDRYLTTSTTSNTISNGTKTFTVGTGLSYSSQQDVVISYDAANHMHARVTSYDSGTGVLVVDVQNHTGAGTYASWTVNVGGMVPLQTVEWGEILGVIGDQTDLANALSAKLETSTAASTYAALAGATFTGEVVTPASTTSNAGFTITPGVAPSAPQDGQIWATTTDLQLRLNGVTETLAEQSWVTSQGYITSSALAPYAPLAGATFTGKVNTLASATGTAGLNIPHGAAPTTPVNGDIWTTTGGIFWRQNGSTQQAADLGSTQTISGNKTFSNASLTLGNSTAASTYNLGTGATLNATTKAINIGTAGVSGSTTNITLGSAVAGALGTTTVNNLLSTVASTTTNAGLRVPHGTAPTSPVNGDIWTTTSGLLARINGSTKTFVNDVDSATLSGSFTFAGSLQTIGSATGSITVNLGTGATLSGSTKSVNVGTGGVAGSTTNIVVGSTTGTSTTTLQGTTNGVTVAADTNSTALATTAYVVGQAGSATPLVNGTAAVGTSLRYARQDHVHPTDTSRAPLASPALTGTPTAPTATAGTNTTQIATTAFVTAAVPASATHIQSLQFASTTAFTRVIDASSQLIAPSVLKVWPSPSNLNGTSTSGAGASASLSITGYTLTSPSAGVAGSARCFFANVSGDLGAAMWGGASSNTINFGRRVSMAFRFAQFPSSTSSVTRVVLGKIHGTAVGDLATAGIGVKYVPNGANFDFQLQVHNGTTLTSVTSSTQYAGGVADLEVVSDGAGNAVLYLNGNQVASTTGAPTGVTAGNATVFAEVESQATTANQPSANIGRLTVNTLNF